jgi:DNA-binding IclR family transcriptional regulator
VAEGFLEQNFKTGRYRLGIKTFEIGCLYGPTRMMNISALAHPLMQQLTSRLALSANLAIRDGAEIVYVATVDPMSGPRRVAYCAGDRFGVYHTALGKAIIAFLPDEQLENLLMNLELTPLTPQTISTPEDLLTELARVKELGYAVDDEESLPGLRCVAAPIWNHKGVVAALSASGSTVTITKERVDEVAGATTRAAREISVQLGWCPPTNNTGQGQDMTYETPIPPPSN